MLRTAGTSNHLRSHRFAGRLFGIGLALVMFASPALGQAPSAPATPVVAPAPAAISASEAAAGALYQQALAAKAVARSRGNEAAARKAGEDQLRRVLADHPQSPVADDATLLLIEDNFCLDDAGYPDCTALAIRGYENFLRLYPYSDRRDEVLKMLAGLYIELSFSYEQDEPWQSPEKAELALGRALELSELLASRSGPDAAIGRELALRIRASGRAFSIVPGGL